MADLNRITAKPGQHILPYVTRCRLVSSSLWCDEINKSVRVWGLEIEFSGGEVVSFPDLSTRKADVKELQRRLVGADLSPLFVRYIVEDYLGYVFGQP